MFFLVGSVFMMGFVVIRCLLVVFMMCLIFVIMWLASFFFVCGIDFFEGVVEEVLDLGL